MSLESVRSFFAKYDLEERIITLTGSTATVEAAAREYGVLPGQICKTLALRIEDEPILLLVAGDKRLDNQKYKARFGIKAKMLSPNEALQHTGHEVGGICPFGLPKPIKTYMDLSLKDYTEVIPAAGNKNSAIKLSVEDLEKFSNCLEWVDVCQ